MVSNPDFTVSSSNCKIIPGLFNIGKTVSSNGQNALVRISNTCSLMARTCFARLLKFLEFTTKSVSFLPRSVRNKITHVWQPFLKPGEVSDQQVRISLMSHSRKVIRWSMMNITGWVESFMFKSMFELVNKISSTIFKIRRLSALCGGTKSLEYMVVLQNGHENSTI